MITLEGKTLGTINISVYKDKDNDRFFFLQADTDDVIPILYVLEDILKLY